MGGKDTSSGTGDVVNLEMKDVRRCLLPSFFSVTGDSGGEGSSKADFSYPNGEATEAI